MLPSSTEVAEAAYYRWERRGFSHGNHGIDWLVAEQELLFAQNYRVIARHRVDGVAAQTLGDAGAPRCRLCERTRSRAAFSRPRMAIPALLGNESLMTVDECDDCRAQYDESVGAALDRFARSACKRSDPRSVDEVPVAAFKGLTWAALSLLPVAEMEFLEDAVEWVSNPDHDLDAHAVEGYEVVLHRLPEPVPFSWAAVARRVDDEAPHPYLVAYFATGQSVIQVPVPFCGCDEDLDAGWFMPRSVSPFSVGRGALDVEVSRIPLATSARPCQPARP